MAYEIGFEGAQAAGGNYFPGYDLIRAIGEQPSGFAEEDLPSDLIGHWIGRQAWLGTQMTNYSWSSNPSEFWGDPPYFSEIDHLCDVMEQTPTTIMYARYLAYGGGFQLWWHNWFKRDRPQGVALPQSHQCNSGEAWPSALAQMTAEAISPVGSVRIDRRTVYTAFDIPLRSLSTNGWWRIDGTTRADLETFAASGKIIQHSDTLYTIPLNQC